MFLYNALMMTHTRGRNWLPHNKHSQNSKSLCTSHFVSAKAKSFPKIVFFIRICTTVWWWQCQSTETCSTAYNKYKKFIRLAQCYSDPAIDKGFINTTGWRYLIIVYTHELSYPAFWTDCTSQKTIHFSRINVLIDSNNRTYMNREPREFDTPNSITGMLHTQIHPTKRDIGHRSHWGSIEWKEFLRTVNVVTVLNKDTGRPRLNRWTAAVAYQRGWFGGRSKTPPKKFRSFYKAEPNSQFRRKYIHNDLIRIRGSLICKVRGTPD
jgi:hypothetical protein